jgi:hypothetical protein
MRARVGAKLRLGLKAVHNGAVHSPLAAVGWPLPAEPQPEPIMTLPRTAAQVLSGHVTLEVRCIDRMLLTFRQPRLQYGQGIHGFFCHHRGNQFVSSALMRPMTERFAADIRHYIDVRGLDLVRFAKGQSKDEVARRYLAGHDGGEQILFAGVAQEKTRVWRTRQRRDVVTGKRYPWLCQEQAMVNHWYFYGFDADFGPFYVKFCGYFPYTGQIYLFSELSRSRKLTVPRHSSVPSCPGDGVADQFGVAGVQSGQCVTQIDGDSVGEGCGDAQHAALAAGAGQPALVEAGDRFGPVDGCDRRAVGRIGDVVHVAEEVITVQPGSVADQELGGRLEVVQAAGVGA